MIVITSVIFVNRQDIASRISNYYIDAKKFKYPHSYGWDEVMKDIVLARTDEGLKPCDKTIPDWENKGYHVAKNIRGWAFAYKLEGNTMRVYEAENCDNLTIDTATPQDFVYSPSTSPQPTPKNNLSLGYGWSAIRHADGFYHIHNKLGNVLPSIKFDEIIKIFRKRRDDVKMYAVGKLGGRNFKVYPSGKCVLIEKRNTKRNIIRLTESQFHKMLVECITKIISEIA